MAAYYKSDFKKIHSKDDINVGNNRVYINLNFNRNSVNQKTSPNTGFMHVNPNFSQLAQNSENTNEINKPKIYINPNFIRPNHTLDGNNLETSLNGKKQYSENSEIICSNIKNLADFSQISQDNYKPALLINKSRYCLVRQSAAHAENKPKEVPVSERVTNTVKIGKYKSVPLSDIKKNIVSVNFPSSTVNNKPLSSNPTNNENCTYSSDAVYGDRFKLIKHCSLASKYNPGLKNLTDIRSSMALNKKRIKLMLKMKAKIMKKSLKKNNIPCPLFRKFGKCKRNLHGTCELLHDKKHVAICRRFLKGVCHNKECLLSHDMTAKKMPTCYFYLKGMCTKDDCPYLHIKLNEKTKICPDFLRGYCENGNKCLNRHTNISLDRSRTSHCPNAHRYTKTEGTKPKETTVDKHVNKKVINTKQPHKHEGKTIDYRYYQDLKENESGLSALCEIIKPSRCKLGSLPSFIQL